MRGLSLGLRLLMGLALLGACQVHGRWPLLSMKLGLLQALFPRRVIRRVRLFQQLVALRWDLQQRSHTNHAGDRQSLGPNTSLNELLRKG